MSGAIHFGFPPFPDLMQLDLTGPAEVFSAAPEAAVHLIWQTLDPVSTGAGWEMLPTTTFAKCPQLDVICVSSGRRQIDVMDDAEALDFLRCQTSAARYVTSVCTGSLVLGAAGLCADIAQRVIGGHATSWRYLVRYRTPHGLRKTATVSPAAVSLRGPISA